MNSNEPIKRPDNWDYRLVRVGEKLRVHKAYYAAGDDQRTEAIYLETVGSFVEGLDKVALLECIEKMVEAVGKEVLASRDIKY